MGLKLSFKPNNTPKIVSPSLTIDDYWFFVIPKEFMNKHESYNYLVNMRYTPSIITAGCKFGFKLLFQSNKKQLNLRIELKVPSKPENFHSRNGMTAISSSRNLVIIQIELSGDKQSYAYAFSLDQNDPTGIYELKYFIEDNFLGSYAFILKKEDFFQKDAG